MAQACGPRQLASQAGRVYSSRARAQAGAIAPASRRSKGALLPGRRLCAAQLRPTAALVSHRLRQAWGASGVRWPTALAEAGRFHRVPVAFCSDGLPLVGPIPQAPGLWVFSGFSGAFAQVPVLAPLLADWLAGPPRQRAQAPRRLRALGLGSLGL